MAPIIREVFMRSNGYFNDNESMKFTKSKHSMNNDNDRGKRRRGCGKLSPEAAEARAEYLVKKFNAPHCRKFYLKCVYHLSESQIANIVESTERPQVKMPVRYFNAVAKQKLTELGY